MQENSDLPTLVDTRVLASRFAMSVEFFEQDRLRDKPRIPFVRIGRAIRYDPADVRRALEQFKVSSAPANTVTIER